MTTAPEAPPVQRRPSRPTPNGIPCGPAGRQGSGYQVASGPLADILEPHIKRLDAEAQAYVNNRGKKEGGGVTLLAERAAAILGAEVEAVYRRLYDIRYGVSRTLNTEMADALLLAVDVDILDEPTLAQLPATAAAAEEMVNVHFDIKGERATPLEKKRLARQLIRFTMGYTADATDELPDIEEWATRVARHRIRNARKLGGPLHDPSSPELDDAA